MIRDAVVATSAGLAIGLVVAIWASRALEALLFGLPVGDLGTVATAAGGLILAALLAAAIPARRATRLSPTEALRIE